MDFYKFYRRKEMRIFISWSGELSKGIAEELKKWIPCVIQSVKVFYSENDIEKGENWNKVLTDELAECKYGIVCLTSENLNSPWINFEAGAISKTLDSRVTALMVDVKVSDIQGPMSRFQATRLDKENFLQLFKSINGQTEEPLDLTTLENTFNGMWEQISISFDKVKEKLSTIKKENINKNKNSINNDIIEEILQLVRKQSTILGSPELILPLDYIRYALDNNNNNITRETGNINEEIGYFLESVITRMNYYFDNLDKNNLHLEQRFLLDLIRDMEILMKRIRIRNEHIRDLRDKIMSLKYKVENIYQNEEPDFL